VQWKHLDTATAKKTAEDPGQENAQMYRLKYDERRYQEHA